MRFAEIDIDTCGGDAERVAVAHERRALGRRQQSLRRHAASIEAVATHLVFFDQRHRHAEGGSRGNGQAAGAAANDTNIGGEYFRHDLKTLSLNNNSKFTSLRASAR